MNVVHLTSSQFHGGPERQMLGLAQALPPAYRTAFISFLEGGRCHAFLNVVRQHGFEAIALQRDTPHLLAARAELIQQLLRLKADVVCCHGYKANLLGRLAARKLGIPALAVSRGWTGETWRIRLYEALDRWNLRWMDHVVCVSNAQAQKVLRAGVRPQRVSVIRNAIHTERFAEVNPQFREMLHDFFPKPPTRIVGAAGRLSPEKGFQVLIDAAAKVLDTDASIGFVLFGKGPLWQPLVERIAALGLGEAFILAGFRDDLDRLLPCLDLFVLPSFTEGLPNVVLEALAAKVPVVATAVGGTPEVLEDGAGGYLVPAGDSAALAERILDALFSESRRLEMGQLGHQRVRNDFTFAAQGRQYQELFRRLAPSPLRVAEPPFASELCESVR